MAGTGWAEPAITALAAVKLLPKGVASQLALIEGYGGQPAPERWYLLAYDSNEENGVHEYVIAGRELVASRSISQFAETLKPEDVFGAQSIKIDSDKVAKLAQLYAQANKVTIANLNYELRKDGEGAAPLWHVTCENEKGEPLGTLVVTATKGAVVTHEGFAAEPANATVAANSPTAPAQEPRRSAAPRVPRAVPVQPAAPEEHHGFFRRLFGGGENR